MVALPYANEDEQSCAEKRNCAEIRAGVRKPIESTAGGLREFRRVLV